MYCYNSLIRTNFSSSVRIHSPCIIFCHFVYALLNPRRKLAATLAKHWRETLGGHEIYIRKPRAVIQSHFNTRIARSVTFTTVYTREPALHAACSLAIREHTCCVLALLSCCLFTSAILNMYAVSFCICDNHVI